MANVTDPLVNQLSGSDPQNLMEYITRQKIYDSRYWKEECFGLTVSDVLEKAVAIQCIGNLPCHCLKLTLKLLQLHPEHELIAKAFVEQDEFKYVRAIGCLYIRMTSRPAEIYDTLEACYSDFRKLRIWQQSSSSWALLTMDEYVHQLLHSPTNNCLGIALPRLPARRILQEAGYLPEGPRPTALQDVLAEYATGAAADNDDDAGTASIHPVLEYLKHKALVEKSPAAVLAWERRQHQLQQQEPSNSADKPLRKKARIDDVEEEKVEKQGVDRADERKHKKKKKKDRNYGSLFKKSQASKKQTTSSESASAAGGGPPGEEEGSEEYWNQERAKLGLGRLK